MSTNIERVKQHAIDGSVHLDAIRGLAAAVVFLSHGRGMFLKSGLRDALTGAASNVPLGTGGAAAAAQHALKAPSIGHEAVIAFFVLSGYFVGGSVLRAERKRKFTWSKYLFQRVTRLSVVLIPALALGWALDFGGLHLLHSPLNIYSGPAGSEVAPELASRLTAPVFLGNVFYLQGILTPCLGTNQPLWSLAYEFWFYIFFPLLITIFAVRTSKLIYRLGAAALLVAIATFCGGEISAYFLLWLFGAAVEPLPLSIPPRFRRLSIFGAAVLLLMTMYLGLRHPIQPFLLDVILGLEFAFLIWAILHEQGTTAPSVYRRSAQGLSRISYTLYLVHMPMFTLIAGILLPVYRPWNLSARSLASLLVIYAIVFVAACVMYYSFERNTERIRGWLTQPRFGALPSASPDSRP